MKRVIFLIKIAAIVLIAAGFAVGGCYAASFQSKKAKVIEDILLMISVTQTQLRYACLPVSDLLKILCENNRFVGLGFIEKCKESVESGEPFPQAWKNSVESEYMLCRLLSNHCGYLIRLGSDIGATDIEGQLGCCEYYKQIFEKELVRREENAKKYSKLYPALGMMLGISAAILIV